MCPHRVVQVLEVLYIEDDGIVFHEPRVYAEIIVREKVTSEVYRLRVDNPVDALDILLGEDLLWGGVYGEPLFCKGIAVLTIESMEADRCVPCLHGLKALLEGHEYVETVPSPMRVRRIIDFDD